MIKYSSIFFKYYVLCKCISSLSQNDVRSVSLNLILNKKLLFAKSFRQNGKCAFFVLHHIFEMSYNPFCQQLYIFTIIRSLIIFSNKGVSSWYCNKRHATKNIFTCFENPQYASTSIFAKNET